MNIESLEIDDLGFNANELRMLKTGCEESLLFMARVFFKRRDRQKLIVSRHHKLVCRVLDLVLEGKIKRLIINIPPGYTKTEFAVIFFILKGLLLNNQAKFLHTSYSGDLALLNSGVIKDLVQDPLFQAMSPMKLKFDTKAKSRWYTEYGGGMMAAATGGQVTGFRAGRMDKSKFTGALIVDDPIKPKDAISNAVRNGVNQNFNMTVKSRLATEDVPIIVIMQRVHDDDLSGYLLEGGTHEKWYHLNLPALLPETTLPYPKKWKCGIPFKHSLPAGPLWEFKHNKDELKLLQKADTFVWTSQYQQRPDSPDAQMLKRPWFKGYESFDPINSRVTLLDGTYVQITHKKSFADTAMKIKERNDFSVFQTWGMGSDGRIYLLDLIRGKWEAPTLTKKYKKYLKRLRFKAQVNNMGVREIYVEDKASGTGLIQTINNDIMTDEDLVGLPKVIGLQRNIDKVSRAHSAAPKIEAGKVVLPENAYWLEDFLAEIDAFNAAMTHRHDDQIDPLLDAVHNMLIENSFIDYTDVVG